MSILKRDPIKVFNKAIDKYQSEIPPQFNKVEIIRQLANPKVDKTMSVSTRSDGKTTNFFAVLAKLSRDLNFCTLVIVRHAELKTAMLAQIRDVYAIDKYLDEKEFSPYLNNDMINVRAYGTMAFIIVDLNNAMDLKNYSASLKLCNLAVFDEFLTLPGDYESNEFLKFKYIFETMDRDFVTDGQQYTNGKRKAMFMGNPVDFSSEFFAYWNLYKEFETQPMNTIQVYPRKRIAIERTKNEAAQKNKNSSMFDIVENDESVTGEFTINTWAIKDPKKGVKPVVIKTLDKYIQVFDGVTPVLSVVAVSADYQYNTELKDNTEKSTYISDKYYRANFEKKYSKGLFNFANLFSKNYILENYPTININKILREQRSVIEEAKYDPKELDRLNKEKMLENIARQYLL